MRKRVFHEQGGMCATKGCPQLAEELDHIDPAGGDARTNLQGLCRDHHLAKTLREAAEGKGR